MLCFIIISDEFRGWVCQDIIARPIFSLIKEPDYSIMIGKRLSVVSSNEKPLFAGFPKIDLINLQRD